LESIPKLKEVGAALSLGPGGISILRKFGIHLEHEGGVVPENFVMWSPDGKQIVQQPYSTKERFGEDTVGFDTALCG
jgi:2-polyprenyl-6-methoxyphenol hydroxylase-like FAD-dependent oxidoreductase